MKTNAKITLGVVFFISCHIFGQKVKEDSTREKNIQEVILTGYVKEKKSNIAGAVTLVSVNELSQEATPNIVTALQGRVPGLQVNSGGTPGGNDSQISIRGLTTVTSGSAPLWVIDGVQTFNPSSLNSDEIESIQVLKDGASAAIYGTSAANGVIVITTKKGKTKRGEFSFRTEATINILRDKIRILNSRQWADVYYAARRNDGISGNFNVLIDNGDGFDIPEFLDQGKIIRSSNTNWVDSIINTTVSHNNELSYRIGKDRFQIYTSLNYARDNGIQNHTYYERYNARLNSSMNFWDKRITIGENFLYSNYAEVKANEFENAILQNPLIPVYTTLGTYTTPTIQDKGNSVANLWSNRKNVQSTNRMLGNMFLEFRPIEGLMISSTLNFDYNEYRFKTRTEPFVQMTSIPTVFSNIDVDDVKNKTNKTIWTSLAQYEKIFGKHLMNIYGGIEFTREDMSLLTKRIRGVDITQYPLYIVQPSSTKTEIKNEIDYRKISQFASLKYVYNDKYILSGTIRRDGSSRFGPNNKFGYFPSASVAWNMEKEDFMNKVGFISGVKLRASWGVNGNDQIANYLYLSSYVNNTSGNVIEFSDYDIDGDGIGTLQGILQTRQANPDIKWESTTQYNAGIDLSFINNRINFVFDIYDKRTKNLLLQPISQAILGEASSQTINAGEISNKGFEFTLGYKSNPRKDFKYSIDFNLAHYKNNVESLDTDNNFLFFNNVSITKPGSPIASFYGLIADGIFRTPEEVAIHANQAGKGIGRIRYRDLNLDGVIDQNDRTIIGNPHPDFTYGVNLSLSYKNFDFNAYFDGKQGNDIYNTQRVLGDFSYFSFNFGVNTLDAWTPSNANSNIPMLSTDNKNNETQTSSYYIEDGSYFRLKTITLGYNFKKDKLFGLKSLRLYVSGQNLFTITSFTGFDYEVSGLGANGIGIAGYGIPHTKTISLGVSTTF